MSDYSYTPTAKNRQATILSLSTLAASLLLYVFSGLLGARGGITKAAVQILAIGLAAFGIYMLVRWKLTSYRYELHDDNLVVVRIVGKKEIMVCNLTLRTAIALFPKKELTERVKTVGKIDRIVNYVCSFEEEDPTCYLFRDADTAAMIVFEPDDAFCGEMQARMTTKTPYSDEDDL